MISSTVSNDQASIKVLNYGATIQSMLFDQKDLLVGPADPHSLSGLRKFLNPVVGRYANRLPSGVVNFNSSASRGRLNLVGTDGMLQRLSSTD